MASRKNKVAAGARRKVASRAVVAAKATGKGPAAAGLRSVKVAEAAQPSKGGKRAQAKGKGKGKKNKNKNTKGAKKFTGPVFKISLVNGKVQVTPKSGNRLVRKSQTHDIGWEIHAPGNPQLTFELVFRREEFEGAGKASTDWPFSASTSPPVGRDGSATGPQTAFAGALRAENDWTAYKYDVVVSDAGTPVARLDPMIIIGKL
jgi:hypothetical protein